MKFKLEKKDGILNVSDFKTMLDYLKTQKDGEFQIEVKKRTKNRSINQNSYYWALLSEIGLQMITYEGVILSADEMHYFFKSRFLKERIEIVGIEGLFEVIKETSTLTTKEFTDYINQIHNFCNENQLSYSLPNEFYV